MLKLKDLEKFAQENPTLRECRIAVGGWPQNVNDKLIISLCSTGSALFIEKNATPYNQQVLPTTFGDELWAKMSELRCTEKKVMVDAANKLFQERR